MATTDEPHRGRTARPPVRSMPSVRWVTLPGGTLPVTTLAGPPGAPAVVLLHGWAATAALNWAPCLEPLARHFSVITFDLRGHGRGRPSSGPFRLEACADDVAAVVHALGIARCIPVGYSMGGAVAQLLWRRHRRLVEGLVLCATAASFGSSLRDRVALRAVAAASPVARAVARDPVARAIVTARSWTALAGVDRSWVLGEIAGHDWVQVARAARAIARFDARPWVGQVDVPTAVLVARDDDVVPVRQQYELARAIEGVSVHHVSGGHLVCLSTPERFVRALVPACSVAAGRAAGRAGDAAAAPVAPAGEKAVEAVASSAATRAA